MRIRVNRQDRVNEQFLHFDRDQIVIGRSEQADIRLDSQFVAPQAALLNRLESGWQLLSLSHNDIDLGGVTVRHGDRVRIEAGQTIGIYPFSIMLDRPTTEQTEDRLNAAEQELCELLIAVHAETLPRMEIDSGADQRRNSPEFLETLERDIEEIARLQRLFEPERGELLEYMSAKVVESIVVGRMVEDLGQSGGALEHNEAWTNLHTGNQVIEGELNELANAVERTLSLAKIEDLTDRVQAVERGFWEAFNKIADSVAEDVRCYAALRHLKKQVKDILFGYGPLEDLLRMPNVSEIMVIDSERLYVEKGGQLEKSGRRFVSDEVTVSIIQRIVDKVGREINRSTPLADARLGDGSRVNAVIDPIAVSGPCLTIRKFPAEKLRVEHLVNMGSLSPAASRFLEAAVVLGKNILISGGTGTGKTTMLNCLSDFIPDKNRIVTVEDTAELQLQKEHVVRMETKNANREGEGAYEIRDLVRNALRMRPDRIVVGECRGAEALDMLQAMNTGHDGSMTTIHANTSRDCILRLEVLVQQAADLPLDSIHRQIASAVHLVVQLTREKKKRFVTQITEFVGYDENEKRIITKDLFHRSATDSDGTLLPTGAVPTFMGDLVDLELIDLDVFLL